MTQLAPIDALTTTAGTQQRAVVDHEVVAEYAEILDDLPPVDVFRNAAGPEMWVVDGFHRVAAAELRGDAEIPYRVVGEGTLRDAILCSCGANAGLRRTSKDKRRAVETLLDDPEWSEWSNRAIARAAAVDEKTVRRIKSERAGTAEGAAMPQPPPPSATETDVQQPEPDNTVRTPVEREHKGKELGAGDLHAINALLEIEPPSKVAERYRITPEELNRYLADFDPHRGDGKAKAAGLSQWFTQDWLARHMVEAAMIQPHASVLEPAAGDGAIVRALLEAGAEVEAYELDPRWADHLKAAHPEILVHNVDYLKAPPGGSLVDGFHYDFAVMNPPYEGGLDGRFLAKALAECENVLALCRLNVLAGKGRFEQVWEEYGGRLMWIEVLPERPMFNVEDGGVGARSDFVILRFGGESEANTKRFRWLLAPEVA